MQQEVNVRVAVRVRPLLQKEKLVGEQMCLRVIPATNQLVLGKDKAFTFDHVLATKHTQGDVYEKTVEPLVKSCFEGYNATVFAYGQTGSGKTYTIGGCNLASITEEEMGIIPRAVKQMFDIMQSNHNREYIVRVSYIEIYKEELRDLLDMETSSKDLHIREDDKGNTLIMGASEWQCETLDDIMSCLEQGSAYRQTATTQMNEYSSRSHSVFTVLIEQRWSDCESDTGRRERKQSESSEIVEETGEIKHFMCAKFHFVDLAGSERAHRTGNVGDRFKESVHINSGLLALGNVISALGDPKKRGTHIPYRDSKITRLLKDSLGGNAKTVMICCISPAASNFDESLNALKYANRARNIKNKPIVNRDVQSIRFEEMASEIKALREELQKQRSTMYTAGTTTTEGDVFERANQDAEHIRSLENKVSRLTTECSHYHMIAEDAYRQLSDIHSKEILSRSQNTKLTDWLELMEEMRNKVPTTLNKAEWENETITKLESELKQCKKDLQSDEEIFADKNREVSALYQRIEDLEAANEELSAQLEEATERMKQQQEQLVEQKVQLEEMVSKLKESHETLSMSQALEVDTHQSQGALPSQRRAKSVPAHMLGKQNSHELHEPTPRNIHTSPALFSVDRVMQNFRARSQLLMDQLDDNDTVMQQHFSDGEAADDEDRQPSQRTFKRNTAQRGTYKINKPRNRPSVVPGNERRPSDEVDSKGLMKTRVINKGSEPVKPVIKVDDAPGYLPGDRRTGGMDSARLRCSTEIQKKRLKQTQIQVQQSTQKMRDLAINIKMKEQLIKELVKTGREAQQMNVQYEHKILELEKEKEKTKVELQDLQRAMTELAADKQHETAEKQKLQSEFQRKLEVARNKMQALQAKQRETMKMANITSQNDKRLQELEMAVEKMRHQQDQLQKRLKDEVDRKVKLEREMQKEQQRIKELELRNEQQQKVLKVKTEEMAAVQRRLRTGVVGSAASRGVRTVSKSASVGYRSEDPLRLEAQKKWLDNEMEKVLQQREQAEALEQELKRREEILAKKEAMLGEKSELEMKKLRSSQVLNRDILTVSTKLESVERKLDEKREELVRTSSESVQDAVKKLQQNRDKLRKQRQVLDSKLHEGTVLSPQEERRLIELDEAVEALEAAMDYKNDSIYRQQEELRKSQMMNQVESGGLVNKLNALSAVETRAMLVKYFEKVIDLRDSDRLKDLQCSELEMKLDEQERIVQDLEGTLQHRTMETDRKLTQQQREYERQIQVLMHQISQTGGSTVGEDAAAELKVQQLEKDLYYYKKTSRELKKKLREVLTSIGVAGADGDKDLLADTPRTSTSGKIANGNNRDQATHSHSSPHLSQHPQNQGWVTERLDRGNRVNPNMPLSARTDKHNNMAANLHLPTRSENKDRNSNSSKGGRTGRSKEEGLYDLPSPRQTTPVKISRSSLRQMTEEEVSLRRSTASQNPVSATPRDSLEVGSKNPWT